MNTDSSYPKWLYCLGLIPTIWLALLIAPSVNGGLPQIMKDFSGVIGNPFHITWCDSSIKIIIIFIIGYVMAITIYLSTKKNYRRREEHGSARWGNANEINKKYKQLPMDRNKLLTQNVCIGLNGKKHRRNLNVLVCGGSGAGKTRFYCKPNVMQCNTSMVILDPKGEIVRDTGELLKKKGYEVKVLDLINMEKSHCYNPFVYLKNDNDVQKLVTNLFKSTTPKGSQSNDPFWDTAASMLLLALVFYLKYEAPEDEQNFPMVMELLRAGEVHEDDDAYVSPLDVLFNRLEEREPEHIAVKYYRDYHSGSAKTLKSIQITLAARLEKFNLESLASLTATDELDFKDCNISYTDYLDYWLDNYCKINLKYNTIQAYKNIIKNHIVPKLGKYRLSTITSVKLNSYITEICEENDFAPTYFKNILKVVKGSFRDACNVYGFIKYNPARDLRLPRFDKKREDVKHLYTQKEIDLILNRFADNDTFTCVFLTSCYTGMRTGEVCALTWDDIDLEKGIINIEHNVYDKPKDDKGRWFIGTTKTQTGTRKVHISQTLKIALQNYKNKQDYLKKLYGRKYIYYNLEEVENKYGKIVEHRIVREEISNKDSKRYNLIFTKENGAYIGTDITRYPYKIIHNELGIKKCRFYDLRGSYATKILNNGIEIRDVADLLGHKNIETTENFYISSTESSRKYATELFDNISKSETINKIIEYKIESQ